ncbi:DUF6879 family protein [Streptomyces johnsoniae]|uniref:DUF6879 domain-containing protein n=1 Tax=Streptomyces johnsoniae TaxID=3075532 RepID=A0ABU2RYL1_9ACTN|nr:DUF6879 family protein [Streptomyces sp. DSM 41886]MDT0441851.1 hypothetical protein [Streptomyces sp. DSM 41886]
MPDTRPPALGPAGGERLGPDEYDSDFDRYEDEVRDRDSWKLEREQFFDEDDDPSFRAFRRGEWANALRLLAAESPALRESAASDHARGSVFRRVRIVEEPLTPYVQWELHALRVQAENGLPVRVVTADAVGHLEREGPLPELVTLGGLVLYRVMYTAAGVPDGAIRYTDVDRIRQWERFIAALYERGEDVTSYVERHVAHLPAPAAPAP